MTRIVPALGNDIPSIDSLSQSGSKRKLKDDDGIVPQKKVRVDSESKEESTSSGRTAGYVILSEDLSSFFSRHSPTPIDPCKLWARTEVTV